MNRRNFLRGAAVASVVPAQLPQGSQAADAPGSSGPLPPSIAALKNRRSEARPIGLDERVRRVARAKQLLEEKRMAGLLMVGGTSLLYFTGIRTGNSERMFAYVVPVKGDPFIVCPYFEEERMRERLTTTPDGDRVRIYTWKEDESPYALVGKGMSDLGLTSGRLGIEEKTPFVFANEIARACPALSIVSATPVTAGCRMIKSPQELQLMRLANDVTLQVYKATWQAGHPGMTNEELSNLMGRAYAQAGFPGYSSCETGIYTALPHGSIKPQVIQENAMVLVDDGCTVEGYPADISRSWVYGKPTDKMQKVFDAVHRAQTAAAAAAKAGSPAQGVDAAARAVIARAGFGADYQTFTHRLGHGIGMDGHEWTYLVRGNETVLEANMTFSDEPGIYLKGEFGIRLEDDMVITPGGGELFTPQSPSLTEPFGTSAQPHSL